MPQLDDKKADSAEIPRTPTEGTAKSPTYLLGTDVRIGSIKYVILTLLKKGHSATRIAKDVERRKSTILEHLHGLEQRGLVIKGRSSWNLSKKARYELDRVGLAGYESGDGSTTQWLKDRAHNIKIKFEVLVRPRDESWLSGWKVNDRLKNQVFYSKKFGDIITTYTGKSIVLQLPVLYYDSAEMADAEAGRIALTLAEKFQKDVVGLRLGGFDIKAQLITQHHAIPQEPYAKFCAKHGISYMDEKVHIDASETPELEFIDPRTSHLDHTRYIEFVKDFSTKPVPTMSDMMRSLSQMQQQQITMQSQIHLLVESQKATSQQIITLTQLLTPPKSHSLSTEKPDYYG